MTISYLTGNWAKAVFFSENGDAPIWTVEPRPADSPHYYNFTSMAMALNEMPTRQLAKKLAVSLSRLERAFLNPTECSPLAPTDSRFRTDIRLLEHGDLGMLKCDQVILFFLSALRLTFSCSTNNCSSLLIQYAFVKIHTTTAAACAMF